MSYDYSKLYAAVIEQALEDVLEKDPVVREDAAEWLFNRSLAPLSFRSVCEYLGWDASTILRRVCSLNLFKK